MNIISEVAAGRGDGIFLVNCQFSNEADKQTILMGQLRL